MNYLIKLVIVCFLLVSCTKDDECFCTETVTDIESEEVYVNEYWVKDCYEPFQQVIFYRWGNMVIDCR